jgi:hypothetical protein
MTFFIRLLQIKQSYWETLSFLKKFQMKQAAELQVANAISFQGCPLLVIARNFKTSLVGLGISFFHQMRFLVH